MIKIKINGNKDKSYFPCRINNYNKYKRKLENVLEGNQNLYYEGVKEIPSGMFGILIKGTDSQDIGNICMFYSLRDINFFYFKKQEREQHGIE